MIVNIENANVRKQGRYILKDVNLQIHDDDNIAIIGPNGCGKSTLLNVIAREVYPLALPEYKNEIFGQSRWIKAELSKKIGLVNQSSYFLNDTSYTPYQIVLSGLYSSIGLDFHHKISAEAEEQTIKELEKVNILHLKDKVMNTLSSGEKTKVLIARAAIKQPKLLILDEASNALDFTSRGDLREAVSNYVKSNTNIIMATHELSEIIKEINRVIIIKDGRIFKDGKKEEVLTEENLYQSYGKKIYLDQRNGLYSAWC